MSHIAAESQIAQICVIPIALLACLLASCEHADNSDDSGTRLFEDNIELSRADPRDIATITLNVPRQSAVLVIVDERGTDVSLTVDSGKRSVQVESLFQGEGLEIAVLDIPEGGTAAIQVAGPPDFESPGNVGVKVLRYHLDDAPGTAVQLAPYRAWTLGTSLTNLTNVQRRNALKSLDRARKLFESARPRDSRLAAFSRLGYARALYYHEVDWNAARREASAAAAAFMAIEVADPLNSARARRLEAAALQEIALKKNARNPGSDEARAVALEIYSKLLSAESPLDIVGRSRVKNFLALMHLESHDYAAAKREFESAIAGYRRAGHRAGVMQSLRNVALLENYRGNYKGAATVYDALVASIDAVTDPDARVSLLINAANAANDVAETDKALDRLLRAAHESEHHGLVTSLARALRGLGILYWSRGDLMQAETFFTRALQIQSGDGAETRDPVGMFLSLRFMGALLRETGDAARALDLHAKASELSPTPAAKVRIRIEIARDHVARNNFGAAVRICREALTLEPGLQNAAVLRDASLTLAQILVATPRASEASLKEAQSIATAILSQTQKDGDFSTEISARLVLSRTLTMQRQFAAAATHLEHAIDLVLRYSRATANPQHRAIALSQQRELFRAYVDLSAVGGTSPAVEKLLLVEALRAVNFEATQPVRGIPVNSDVLDEALLALANKSIELTQERERLSPSPDEIGRLQFDMAKLRATIDSLHEAARKQPGDTARDMFANSRALRAPAPSGSQVSYVFGNRAAYVWQRSRDGSRIQRLEVEVEDIEQAVVQATAIDPLQDPAAYDAAILRLSRWLLPQGLVTQGTTRIEIVADDKLSLVPFAALQSPTDPARRLVETHVVSQIPTLFAQGTPGTRKPRRWQLVAIADAKSAAPLPAAELEVDTIADGFGATGGLERGRTLILKSHNARTTQIRDAFQEGADIVHFATHALIDRRHPMASLLMLPTAPGAKQAYLTAGQIREWHGPGGLVFLSACETAVGPTQFAQGMPGLQQAFLHAGASRVVATLWPVEDRTASLFARDFYSQLAKGFDAAEALARAQRHWLASETGSSPQKVNRRRAAAWGYVIYER